MSINGKSLIDIVSQTKLKTREIKNEKQKKQC